MNRRCSVSETYHRKTRKGQADERYRENLKKWEPEKYRKRVTLSSYRSKAARWRRQLQDALRTQLDTKTKLENSEVNNIQVHITVCSSVTIALQQNLFVDSAIGGEKGLDRNL